MAAYRWLSMMDVLHAQGHSRQKPQPPGLLVASVKRPWHPMQAQLVKPGLKVLSFPRSQSAQPAR